MLRERLLQTTGTSGRRSIKRHLIVGVVVALGALFLTWLLLGETSPLDEYFLWHVGVPNFWRALNAPPFIAGAIISNSRGGPPFILFIVLLFIYWFIIGFVLSTLFARVFRPTLR